MDNFIVRGIPAAFIENFWHFALPYIKRALDHANGEVSPEDLKIKCLERDAQLWLVYSADNRIVGAATTEIVIYPQMKVCRIITLAGSGFDEWMNMSLQIIEMWAIEQGCKGLEALTRKGFIPKLQNVGFKYKYAVLHKRLVE